MISVAAGMSTCGKIPVCDTFAAFCSRRDYDQAYISVAYAGLNVKMVGTDPGVSAEHNGGTHMAFEDVGIMRNIPTMTVFEPADNVQLEKAIPVMLNTYGPMYMRLFRRIPHKPVSYTHLDVYKRQGKGRTKKQECAKDLGVVHSIQTKK